MISIRKGRVTEMINLVKAAVGKTLMSRHPCPVRLELHKLHHTVGA